MVSFLKKRYMKVAFIWNKTWKYIENINWILDPNKNMGVSKLNCSVRSTEHRKKFFEDKTESYAKHKFND